MSTAFIVRAVLWLLGPVFLFRIPRCGTVVASGEKRPSVSVIIPARNEEKTLPALLASLKGQVLADDEVLVVDDHSEDGTRDVAEQNGARVIRSEALPPGWLGKPWACHQGASAAAGQLLVFLDADTVLDTDGLGRIVGTHQGSDGVLSVQPYHRMRRAYEELSAFFNLIMMAAMGSFTVLGRAIKPIGLFGPAVVLTKQQYLDSGGYAGVKGEILEDLAYGSEFKKRRVGTYCYGGRHAVSFRMYPDGIRQLVAGWSKGFAAGAGKTSIPVLILIIAWMVGATGTARHLARAMIAADANGMTLWGILYLCYALQIYWMLARIGSFKLYTALLYPVPLLFFFVVFAYSIFIVFIRRRVQWKGRELDVKGGNDNAVPPAETHHSRN